MVYRGSPYSGFLGKQVKFRKQNAKNRDFEFINREIVNYMIKILSSFNYIGLKHWEEMKPTTAEGTAGTTPKSTSAISLKKAKSRTKNPRKRLSSSATNASASDASPPSTPSTGNSFVETPTTAQTSSREERVSRDSFHFLNFGMISCVGFSTQNVKVDFL